MNVNYNSKKGYAEQLNSRFKDSLNRKGKNYDFQRDIYDGKIGEDIAKIRLQKIYGEDCVQDCTDLKVLQTADVDFIAYSKSLKKLVAYEVKTDLQANNTGNLAFETTSNGNPGCLMRSAADYVIYITMGTNKNPITHYFEIDLNKWRNMILQSDADNNDAFRWNINMGEGAKGHLYKADFLVEQGIAKKLY